MTKWLCYKKQYYEINKRSSAHYISQQQWKTIKSKMQNLLM